MAIDGRRLLPCQRTTEFPQMLRELLMIYIRTFCDLITTCRVVVCLQEYQNVTKATTNKKFAMDKVRRQTFGFTKVQHPISTTSDQAGVRYRRVLKRSRKYTLSSRLILLNQPMKVTSNQFGEMYTRLQFKIILFVLCHQRPLPHQIPVHRLSPPGDLCDPIYIFVCPVFSRNKL